MEYKYFDAHSHLNEQRFDEGKEQTRHEIAKEMQQRSIGTITIGVDREWSASAVDFANTYEHIFASIGQHPVDNKEEVFDPEFYQDLLDNNKDKVVCIGECGLDYYWPKKDIEAGKATEEAFEAERERQINLFKQQIDFAVTNDLPLMLHVRSYKDADAHLDAFSILDEKQKEHENVIRANFHFFTEPPEIAKQVIDRGFYISFPGVITFADLDETLQTVPLDRMFSETDTPYAAPKPHRGENATPLMIEQIVSKIAEAKNLEPETVRTQLIKNIHTFFNI